MGNELKEPRAHKSSARSTSRQTLAAKPQSLKAQNVQLRHELAEREQAEHDVVLLKFALNNVHEAAFLIDKQARFHFVNEESCRILGYPCVELLGLGVSDVDPDFLADRWRDHWGDLKAQRSLIFESRHKTKDGHIFLVEVNANYFEYGGSAYNLALVRDITERKRAEEELRQSEQKFRSFVEESSDGITLVDEQGAIIEWNPAREKMTGLPASQVIGQKLWDVQYQMILPELRKLNIMSVSNRLY
jgi:PAS domain S-box-containing protein